MYIITIFLQSAFKHWKFLHLSVCLMIWWPSCFWQLLFCTGQVSSEVYTVHNRVKYQISILCSCFMHVYTMLDLRLELKWMKTWERGGSLMRQTARFKEQLRLRLNSSAWLDSSVGSNPFQPVLTSIQKLPHTKTTLRQQWEQGGADDIGRCYLWSHWWNTRWKGHQVLVAVEK